MGVDWWAVGRRAVGGRQRSAPGVWPMKFFLFRSLRSSLTHPSITVWQHKNYFLLARCGHPVPTGVLCTTLVKRRALCTFSHESSDQRTKQPPILGGTIGYFLHYDRE